MIIAARFLKSAGFAGYRRSVWTIDGQRLSLGCIIAQNFSIDAVAGRIGQNLEVFLNWVILGFGLVPHIDDSREHVSRSRIKDTVIAAHELYSAQTCLLRARTKANRTDDVRQLAGCEHRNGNVG